MFRNELIKAGIQKSFENGTSRIADRICYGYSKTSDCGLTINQKEAQIVRFIFEHYLSGDSLGKIADALTEKKVASPSGKDKWSRKVVDGLLSNEKYCGRFCFKKPSSWMASRLKIIPGYSIYWQTITRLSFPGNCLMRCKQRKQDVPILR